MIRSTIDDRNIEVREGIESAFHYHLGPPKVYVSLCGAKVMATGIPVSAWGSKSPLRERWCKECYRRASLPVFIEGRKD